MLFDAARLGDADILREVTVRPGAWSVVEGWKGDGSLGGVGFLRGFTNSKR